MGTVLGGAGRATALSGPGARATLSTCALGARRCGGLSWRCGAATACRHTHKHHPVA